jgi:hypothetical protein
MEGKKQHHYYIYGGAVRGCNLCIMDLIILLLVASSQQHNILAIYFILFRPTMGLADR